MKTLSFISCYFSKKTDLYLSWTQTFNKTFLANGIIYLLRSQNFPKNKHFSLKEMFFGKFCERTKLMIPMLVTIKEFIWIHLQTSKISAWDKKWYWHFIRNYAKYIQMSDIITFCTKILTVEIASFSFVSSAIPCEFAMVPYVCILLSPQEEQVHWSLRGQIYTSGSTFIKKINTFVCHYTIPR